MARIVCNKKTSVLYLDEEVDVNNLGEETQAEKQMKFILEKQLNTQLTMKDQFSQHRTFISPSLYKSPTELIEGTCYVSKFRELEKEEELRQELQRCGLEEQDIKDYLDFKSKRVKRLVNPSIWAENLARIEKIIQNHNEKLLEPQTFQNVKKLSRHEMEIERALYAGCAEKGKLSALLTEEASAENSYATGAFSYIKDLSDELLLRGQQKKRLKVDGLSELASDPFKLPSPDQQKRLNVEESSELASEPFKLNSNIHHVVVPLESSEVAGRRLSIEDIKKMPKFKNYSVGQPSKTLYIKNLHVKATEEELRSLFGCFEEENGTFIGYRICTGRMKGQAFVHFSDSNVAEKAFNFANGFLVKGKPIIIEFGKKT